MAAKRINLSLIAFSIFSIFVVYLGSGNHCVRGSLELLIETSESLALHLHTNLPPMCLLDLIGMTLCCIHYRQKQRSKKCWFETLMVCMLMHLGGTTLTGLLLGQLPGWMMVSGVFPAVLLSWWLVFCSPYDAFWNLVNSSTTPLQVLSTLDILNVVHCITSWGADKVLHNEFHVNGTEMTHSYVACILAGVLSSCGGTLLASMFQGEKSALFAIGNFEGTRPVNNAFLLSLLYYILVNKSAFMNIDIQMSEHSARALVGAALIYLHATRELYPQSNVCQWVSSAFLSAALVPPVLETHSKRGASKKHD